MRVSWLLSALAGLALLAALGACNPATSSKVGIAENVGGTAMGNGKTGFQIYKLNCAVCHGATGVEGGVVGPSLRHENLRMDYGDIISWIEDPQPPMPHLYPHPLTKKEVRDVAAYVASL